jgi:hypothetical protein
MKTLKITKDKLIFTSEDIDSVFWRVEYYGVLSQYLIKDVLNNGNALFNISGLTDLRNGQYNLKEEIKYSSSSTFGLDILLRSPDSYFTDLRLAKIASINRYDKEVNPNGNYRVARYFDDVFEAYDSGILNKKDAKEKASELNKRQRHYVSYGIVEVTP